MERACASNVHVLPGHAVVVQSRGRWLARDAVLVCAFGGALALDADITGRVCAAAGWRATLLASRRCAEVQLLPVIKARLFVVVHARDDLHVFEPLRAVFVILAPVVHPLDRGAAVVVGGVTEARTLRPTGPLRLLLRCSHRLATPLQCVQGALLLAAALIIEAQWL